LGKILLFNRLSVILLINMVILSINQLILPSTEYTILKAGSVSIDETYPKLIFSTYLGGNDGGENGNGIVVTKSGNFYVTGKSKSNDFPTQNAYNNTYSGNTDAFVAKLTHNGLIIWSTYLGGNDFDSGFSIAVANDESCYITGVTFSDNFPTQNAYDDTLGAFSDAFITKFVDAPIPEFTINGFLIFIVVMPNVAFMIVFGLIIYKKRRNDIYSNN